MPGLLDILKEADLRADFADLFATSANRGALPKEVPRKRLCSASTASTPTHHARASS